jgi:hypothetical protein
VQRLELELPELELELPQPGALVQRLELPGLVQRLELSHQ